eukprot:1829053-Pleurochrysis_carterae.AAC.1
MLEETQIHPTRLRFHGASNKNMPVKGRCDLDLHLGGIVCRTRAFVFERLAEQMLLDANSLPEHGLVFDARLMAICTPGKLRNDLLTQLTCFRVPTSRTKPDCVCTKVEQAAPSTSSSQTAMSCSPPY